MARNPESGGRSRLRLLAAAVLLTASCTAPKSRSIDFEAEVKKIAEVESKAVDLYNDAIDQMNQKKLDDHEFIKLLEERILPDWRAMRKHLDEIKGLRGAQARRIEALKSYAAAREEGWVKIIDGLAAGDSKKVDEGFAQEDEAEKILE